MSKQQQFILIFLVCLLGMTTTFLFPHSLPLVSGLSHLNHDPSSLSQKDVSQINIPPHVNLTDFYNTYGERLLGNKDLPIISREEWGADNHYADLTFIRNTCKRVYCSKNAYDAEDTFAPPEYWRSRELFLNYRKNFQDYDNLFLQTLKKKNGVTYQYLPVEQIIIHHTAGKFTTSLKDSEREVRRIYFAHAVQRRWRDIGYHYLIDGAGHIFEGTLGGKYSVGAHTFMHNRATVGIALMGDFRPGHDKITPAMAESLGKLVRYLAEQYHWDLSKRIFYLRKKDYSGREWTNKIVKGHNEVDYRSKVTDCPGVNDDYLRSIVYPYLYR